MSNDIKLSVIVPIYNVEKYLDRCVNSLISQTLEEIEIILVNDGSPDGSQNIIDRYVKNFPQKVVGLAKPNGGLSDARNYGISHAKGEYVGFIDSDDYADVTMFEKMYNEAKRSNSDIVTCGYYGVDENTNKFKYFQKGNMSFYGFSLSESPKLLYINSPYAWNKIYRRELFIKTGILFPKGLLYEDIATVYPLFVHANKISKVDEPLVYYVLKREGAITATFNDKITQMYSSLARMNDLYIEAGKFSEFKDYLCFINVKHTILRFRDFVLYNDKKLQFRMIQEGFDLLNKYFVDWRNNKMFFELFYKDNKIRSFFAKRKLSWQLFSLTPNFIIINYQKVKKYFRKVKKGLTSKKYKNKYYYSKLCKKSPIKENQVLFESFHGTTIGDSPFAMMKELLKEGKYKIYFTTKKELKKEHRQLLKKYGYNIELVCLNSKKYQKILAESKYLVNNVSFPTYMIKRKGQVYINTWHGTPLKTLGKKMVKGIQDMSNIQRNFLESDYLLHPNEFTMGHMMEDYNLNELFTGKVILEGYPRNSVFLDRDKELEIRKRIGTEDKEVFAYMPTWRGATSNSVGGDDNYAEVVKRILRIFDENLNDHQIMYVNLHPLVQDSVDISGYLHIKKFPEEINNYEFLNSADILITDYSSVFFDFSLTRKPIVLFMYDYDEYMRERGMYLNINELPFEKIYNLETMVKYLSKKDKGVDYAKGEYRKYVDRFLPYDSIDSTKMINDLVFTGENNGIKVFDYKNNKNKDHTLILMPKIKHINDYKLLDDASKIKNSIVCFLRRDFTPHILAALNKKFNNELVYIVSDTNMNLTFKENVKLFIDRKLGRLSNDKIYLREIERILPNIKIREVISKESNYRNDSIKKAIDRNNI